MPVGTVKWFNNTKGFGFILPENGGEDLFAHYSSIVMDGYRTLRAGQKVHFEVTQGPKGLHAINIHAVVEDITSDTEDKSQSTSLDSLEAEDA